ncbi:hypothetical protein DY000_02029238 [Brassica cretica]|uniref:Replication protein A 70 kDa DNA-binding subunit B/D first OB fold domain-containing protein n=1 Tax=Brassica cretica TaxID=69181 RepID=A0ABQ7DPP1_BRACR|nr:hypothetical protein DY000_02029238 [Brassica cretica]
MAMVRAKKNIISYVRELKPRKDTLRIEVRIVRLWRNYNKESGNTIEMVVVDKEGIRIHASVGEGKPFGMAQRGNFSGIYRKVQLKPLKWDGEGEEERPVEALMILKYGGVLTHAGRRAW